MFYASLFLCTFLGFISLSLEIFWFNVFSLVTQGRAGAFGFVLSFVLFGIAYGAKNSHIILNKYSLHPVVFTAHAFLFVGLIHFITLPLYAYFLTVSYFFILFLPLCIFITAFVLGMIFPALCHYGIQASDAAGEKVSWLYFANIVGASLGPIVTGYFFLDWLGRDNTSLLFSLLLFFIASILYLNNAEVNRYKSLGFTLSFIVITVLSFDRLYTDITDKLHFRGQFNEGARLAKVIETRSGIIAVEKNPDGDIVYGGGIYDGRFTVDPVVNTNLIDRAYFIMAYHPDPKKILEIGLGTGTWLKVILFFPAVETVDVIEINRGYVELIAQTPLVADVLTNPKATIYVDDGRRWLTRNPSKKYDLIIMNTSFHWRENITAILSREFIRLLKQHLEPDGLVYWNTTGSEQVTATAASEFAHVMKFRNFVVGSHNPFTATPDHIKNRLMTLPESILAIEGIDPIFNRISMSPTEDLKERYQYQEDLFITDDNMRTEYKLASAHFINQVKTGISDLWEWLF